MGFGDLPLKKTVKIHEYSTDNPEMIELQSKDYTLEWVEYQNKFYLTQCEAKFDKIKKICL